jgi:hypothetical protein
MSYGQYCYCRHPNEYHHGIPNKPRSCAVGGCSYPQFGWDQGYQPAPEVAVNLFAELQAVPAVRPDEPNSPGVDLGRPGGDDA